MKLLNSCPRLTHLSLTGVAAFQRDDFQPYCRQAPPGMALNVTFLRILLILVQSSLSIKGMSFVSFPETWYPSSGTSLTRRPSSTSFVRALILAVFQPRFADHLLPTHATPGAWKSKDLMTRWLTRKMTLRMVARWLWMLKCRTQRFPPLPRMATTTNRFHKPFRFLLQYQL